MFQSRAPGKLRAKAVSAGAIAADVALINATSGAPAVVRLDASCRRV